MSETSGRTYSMGRRRTGDTQRGLTFILGDEQFAIPLLNVKEITGYVSAVPVPRSLGYLKGIINLRSRIIPVIDLRRKFKMPDGITASRTCIVVVEQNKSGKTDAADLLVDAVPEIGLEEIDPPSGMLAGASCLDGLIKTGSSAKPFLNLHRTLQEKPDLMQAVKPPAVSGR